MSSDEIKKLFNEAYQSLLSSPVGIEINSYALHKIDPARAQVLFDSAMHTFEDPERNILVDAPHIEVNEIAADAAVKRIETQAVKAFDAPVFTINAPGVKEEIIQEPEDIRQPASFLLIFGVLAGCSFTGIFSFFYFENLFEIKEYALYYSASLIPLLFSISLFLHKKPEIHAQSLK